MNKLLHYLKNNSIHTEKLAIARFLLAFALLLSLLFNSMDIVANHSYTSILSPRHQHALTPVGLMKQVDLFYVFPPETGRIIAIVILLGVMSGYAPKITAPLQTWVCYSVHNYFIIINGADHIVYIISILLLPVCLTDPRMNQWRPKKEGASRSNIVANIAMIAIKLQVFVIYAMAGAYKLFIPAWRQGTALYYFTSGEYTGAPGWLRSIIERVTLTPFVYVLSWGVIAFELLLALSVFAPKRIKKVMLILGLLFHFFIIMLFGLVSFFFIMTGLLILYLDDDSYSVKLYRKILGRSSKSKHQIRIITD